jgi:hypothetical protein
VAISGSLPRPLFTLARETHAPYLVVAAIGVVTALPAAWDLWRVFEIAARQLGGGPAAGTDFLNLYSGARLFDVDPAHVYDQHAQTTLQR